MPPRTTPDPVESLKKSRLESEKDLGERLKTIFLKYAVESGAKTVERRENYVRKKFYLEQAELRKKLTPKIREDYAKTFMKTSAVLASLSVEEAVEAKVNIVYLACAEIAERYGVYAGTMVMTIEGAMTEIDMGDLPTMHVDLASGVVSNTNYITALHEALMAQDTFVMEPTSEDLTATKQKEDRLMKSNEQFIADLERFKIADAVRDETTVGPTVPIPSLPSSSSTPPGGLTVLNFSNAMEELFKGSSDVVFSSVKEALAMFENPGLKNSLIYRAEFAKEFMIGKTANEKEAFLLVCCMTGVMKIKRRVETSINAMADSTLKRDMLTIVKKMVDYNHNRTGTAKSMINMASSFPELGLIGLTFNKKNTAMNLNVFTFVDVQGACGTPGVIVNVSLPFVLCYPQACQLDLDSKLMEEHKKWEANYWQHVVKYKEANSAEAKKASEAKAMFNSVYYNTKADDKYKLFDFHTAKGSDLLPPYDTKKLQTYTDRLLLLLK